jgi:hypothetical protein
MSRPASSSSRPACRRRASRRSCAPPAGSSPHVHGGDLEWAAERAPALATAGARLFARAGLRPPSSGVKEARATLRALLIEPGEAPPAGGCRRTPEPGRQRRGAWCLPRPRRGPRKGGAGGAAGGARVPRCLARALRRPCGSARSTFLADRVGDELDAGGLERAGLTALAGRHPRDLSGGERRASRSRSSARPTRRPPRCASTSPRRHGPRRQGRLASDLRADAAAGNAVLVATHDPEFAALTADRVILLAPRPIADGPVAELLSGGWYFSTATARIVDGRGGSSPLCGDNLPRPRRSRGRRTSTQSPVWVTA